MPTSEKKLLAWYLKTLKYPYNLVIPRCFLSLSLLSIDLAVADLTVAMFQHLFWRLSHLSIFSGLYLYIHYFQWPKLKKKVIVWDIAKSFL